MAFSSYPFDNQDTTESQYSKLFRELQDTGVIGSTAGTDLTVTGDASGLNVKLAIGSAIVRGFLFTNDAVYTQTIAPADTQPRIDTVVLRLDPTANSIVPAVLKGVAAASNAVAATPTQTDTGIYEFVLAYIAVAANAPNISAANVTDARVFTGRHLKVRPSINRDPAPRAWDINIATDKAGRLERYDPSTSSWLTREPIHWGTGTVFPPGAAVGDTYIHSGLMSLMRFNGAAWRQAERSELASKAQMESISANWSSVLHPGFEVLRGDSAMVYRWTGDTWFVQQWLGSDRGLGGNGPAAHCLYTNASINYLSQTGILWQNVYLPSGGNADLFGYVAGNGAVVCKRAGKVQLRAYAVSDSSVGGYSRLDILTTAPQFGTTSPITASQRGPGTYSGSNFLVQDFSREVYVRPDDYFILAVTMLSADGRAVTYSSLQLDITYI